MNWQALLDSNIQDFISRHAQDDVKALALQKPPHKDWPIPLILDQIKARQKAQIKMPGWIVQAGIIFPASDLIEQASSEACALLKASIVQGDTFVDLTAGTGADCFAFLHSFRSGIAIEQDTEAAEILSHNASCFNQAEQLKVINTNAETYIDHITQTDLIFLDPQRRDDKRKGKFDLQACDPDIIALLPKLKTKTRKVLLKTSPVLDIYKTLNDLSHVTDVYIVQYRGDCKELLFLIDFDTEIACDDVTINAIKINDHGQAIDSFTFNMGQERGLQSPLSLPLKYIYEPGPAFQKSGGYNVIADRYNLKKLHANTHLYTGNTLIEDFPGRRFLCEDQCAANKKNVKKILPDLKAGITVRNFPSTPDQLRKRLSVRDGGNVTLFACTLSDERKILLKCIKIQQN